MRLSGHSQSHLAILFGNWSIHATVLRLEWNPEGRRYSEMPVGPSPGPPTHRPYNCTINWLLNELIHIKIVNMRYSTNIASTTWFNDERRRTMRYVDTDAAFLQLREPFDLRPANANSLRFTKYTILSGLFLSANEAN